MDSFEGDNGYWNGVYDCFSFNDFYASDICWTSSSPIPSASERPAVVSLTSTEKGLKRGREQKRSSQSESKATRERLRREKMNHRLSELWSFLHPGRAANKGDKSGILGDALGALTRLQSEAQELKLRNQKLQDDIRNLKAEKNELREEKMQLKARKENMQLKVKGTTAGSGLIAVQAGVYQNGGNKLMGVYSYGGLPMWQWISPAVLDTSQDHVLRPPVA